MQLTRLGFAYAFILFVFILSTGLIAMGKNDDSHSLALDFPHYIGEPLASLMGDIAREPGTRMIWNRDDSLGGIVYSGCWLSYPPDVDIYVIFSKDIYQPTDKEEVINDIDHFKDDTIGYLEVRFFCPSRSGQ